MQKKIYSVRIRQTDCRMLKTANEQLHFSYKTKIIVA